jgi:hypothetical protein
VAVCGAPPLRRLDRGARIGMTVTNLVAGTVGCVLAARLSEGGVRVLLLEAGGARASKDQGMFWVCISHIRGGNASRRQGGSQP